MKVQEIRYAYGLSGIFKNYITKKEGLRPSSLLFFFRNSLFKNLEGLRKKIVLSGGKKNIFQAWLP